MTNGGLFSKGLNYGVPVGIPRQTICQGALHVYQNQLMKKTTLMSLLDSITIAFLWSVGLTVMDDCPPIKWIKLVKMALAQIFTMQYVCLTWCYDVQVQASKVNHTAYNTANQKFGQEQWTWLTNMFVEQSSTTITYMRDHPPPPHTKSDEFNNHILEYTITYFSQ